MPDLDAVDIGRDRDHPMGIMAREVGVHATRRHGTRFLVRRAGGLEQRRANARETVGLDDWHGGSSFGARAEGGSCLLSPAAWSQSDRPLAMTCNQNLGCNAPCASAPATLGECHAREIRLAVKTEKRRRLARSRLTPRPNALTCAGIRRAMAATSGRRGIPEKSARRQHTWRFPAIPDLRTIRLALVAARRFPQAPAPTTMPGPAIALAPAPRAIERTRQRCVRIAEVHLASSKFPLGFDDTLIRNRRNADNRFTAVRAASARSHPRPTCSDARADRHDRPTILE